MYEIVAVPAATPVITPFCATVAILTLLEDQTPPGVAKFVIVEPTQTVLGPPIGIFTGSAFTLITNELVVTQPEALVTV